MASRVGFIGQQGFTTEGCADGLYSALMFQPRLIVGVIISGVVLQSSWVFLALSTVLLWSALVPSHNPFDAVFNRMMADPMRLAAMPAAPPPRRFSQAMAGAFAMSIAITILTGASRASWLFEAVFVAASMSVVVRRVCLPAKAYHLLWRGTRATPCPSSPGPRAVAPLADEPARQSLHVELDTFIARPIDDVFGRLTALSDYSQWMPGLGVFIRSGQTSNDPVGAGTTYYDRGWMGTFLGEIAEFQAPTRVAFTEKLQWLGVTVMEARPRYELVATPSGTEVHHTAEGTLFGIFNVLRPAVAWMARGERQRTLRALKDSLERDR